MSGRNGAVNMMMEWDYLLRLIAAGLMGAVIGIDRAYHSKGAGVRTHFLVCLGSALIMIVSKYGFSDLPADKFDPARMAAQVVIGIGFLGAGTIILQKQFVRGLTTAAGLWAAAGIGLAVGAGMYLLALAATILTLIGLEFMKFAAQLFGGDTRLIRVVVTLDGIKRLEELFAEIKAGRYSVENYSISRNSPHSVRVSMMIKSLRHRRKEEDLAFFVQKMDGVTLEKYE